MEKKKALGRGMAALIPDVSALDDQAAPSKVFFHCDIENIVPNRGQPRKKFNEETLLELAESIKEKGILQPILVRRLSDFQYELIAGERRWRAAQKAGLSQVPVIIRESQSSELLEEALIENIQREDLNDIEEGRAYETLMNVHKYTQEQVAKKVGKKRSTIANSMRLLSLPEDVQTLLMEKKLSAGHARALLAIEDEARQKELAQQIIAQGLSVRDIEALVKIGTETTTKKREERSVGRKDAYVSVLEQELSQHFKAKVRIHRAEKKGRIDIEYFGEDELNRIVALLKA